MRKKDWADVTERINCCLELLENLDKYNHLPEDFQGQVQATRDALIDLCNTAYERSSTKKISRFCMNKLITFADIAALSPCTEHHPSRYIPESWTGTLLDVLTQPNAVAPTERIWVVLQFLPDRERRLFAVDCARRALSRVKDPDPRSLKAVEVAEKFANGEATEEELRSAYTAADAAYVAAAVYAAYAAAAATADAAAYAAAYATNAAAYAAAVDAAYAAAETAAEAAYAGEKERLVQLNKLAELIGG